MKIRCWSVLRPCAWTGEGEVEVETERFVCVDVVVVAAVHAIASTSAPASISRRGDRIGRGVYRRAPSSEGGVWRVLLPRPRIEDQRRIGGLVEVERVG